MEASLVQNLRGISLIRRNGVEFLQTHVPSVSFLEINWVFHSVCLATTIVLLATLYDTTKSMNLFSFHPMCMIFACCFFLPEGIVAYKNHFLLESLSPIMQHTKRVKVRSIHQTMQSLGVGLMLLGLLFIVADKMELHMSIIPFSVHSISASVLLLAIIAQVIVGQEKLQFHQVYATNRRIRRWHGDMGLLIWDVICLTLISGLWSLLSLSFFSIFIFFFPLLLWLAVILQLIGKNAIKDEELDSDGDIRASLSAPQRNGHNNNSGGVDYDYGAEDNKNDEDLDDDSASDIGLLAATSTPTHRRSYVNLAGEDANGSDQYLVERAEDTSSFLREEDINAIF